MDVRVFQQDSAPTNTAKTTQVWLGLKVWLFTNVLYVYTTDHRIYSHLHRRITAPSTILLFF